jgi:hypothetical protein
MTREEYVRTVALFNLDFLYYLVEWSRTIERRGWRHFGMGWLLDIHIT